MEFFNNVAGDPLKPSLFELVAQEQLRDLLQPALKYVLSVFAQRYPRYLLRIVNRHEEFYALIMFFVERHFLRTHNASFSENFYGLKRRRKPLIEPERARAAFGGVFPEEKLRAREARRSLLFLVGLPYLRAKLHDYYEDLGGGIDSDLLDASDGTRQTRRLSEHSLLGWFRRTFKRLYPWMNMGFESWLLVYNILYLFDRTASYRPWLSWMGVDLRRLDASDFRAAALAVQKTQSRRAPPGNIIARVRRLLTSSPRLLLESLKVLLPTAIFFVKFLEWWYSPSSPARALATPALGPAIPPPKLLPPHPQGLRVDGRRYGECPLCAQALTNATALPSGYVFCYRCAHAQVEQHGRCPVTLLPAQMWQLRKILV